MSTTPATLFAYQRRPSLPADPPGAHYITMARPVLVLTAGLDTPAQNPAKIPANKNRVALGIINLSGAVCFASHEWPVKSTARISIPNGVEKIFDMPGPQNAIYIAGTVNGLVECWETLRVFGDDFVNGNL